jgi:hypothetical protein
METAEQPSDLARLHIFVWREGIRGAPQLLSHVAVRDTVQGLFPRQEHRKEHALVARQGVERSDATLDLQAGYSDASTALTSRRSPSPRKSSGLRV